MAESEDKVIASDYGTHADIPKSSYMTTNSTKAT